jgi:DNA-binding CsgD family transcriptional regulator
VARHRVDIEESTPEDAPATATARGALCEGVDSDFAPLVRRLVAHAGAVGAATGTRVAGEAVLLDVEVEGVRCLLLDTTDATTAAALSPREQEIVRMVAQGYPNKTIAAVLDISSWTVSTYLRRIFAKLGVRSRAAMVAKVMAAGRVAELPPDEPQRIWRRRFDREDSPGGRE